MKTIVSSLLGGALAFALGSPAVISAAPETHARVLISYENPMDFTDFKDRQHVNERTVEGYMEEFTRVLQRLALSHLPDGHQLELTFTDIDMAGDFELQRGPDGQDVRIIKAIYPPRLSFNYVVRDADGVTVSSGSEKLSDLAFQNNLGINRENTFFFETELMRGWLRTLR